LNALPTGLDAESGSQYALDQPFEFSISEVFSVPFVGAVASGTVLNGSVRLNDPVLLGPDSLGQWKHTSIKSIHRKRVNVSKATAGQSICFALKKIKRSDLRKGMILVSAAATPRAVMRFQASILILYHNATISKKYQSMLHVSSIRQTVRIVDIEDKDVLRTGDRASVVFEFMTKPEAIKEGQSALACSSSSTKLMDWRQKF
jgi:GTPase